MIHPAAGIRVRRWSVITCSSARCGGNRHEDGTFNAISLQTSTTLSAWLSGTGHVIMREFNKQPPERRHCRCSTTWRHSCTASDRYAVLEVVDRTAQQVLVYILMRCLPLTTTIDRSTTSLIDPVFYHPPTLPRLL